MAITEEIARMVNAAKTRPNQPVTWSDLFKIIAWIASVGGNGATSPLRVASGDFSGNDYTNAALIGKTAQTDFDVIAGSFLTVGADYTFDDTTGTITIPSGAADILILIYN